MPAPQPAPFAPPAARQGLLLLAHGARDPAWARPFEAVAARVRAAAPTLDVRLAFLELMSPTLEAAAQALVDTGCLRIDIVPVFLGVGGHVRRDVPVQVARLQALHARVDWRLHPALGETERVGAALAAAALDFTDICPPDPESSP